MNRDQTAGDNKLLKGTKVDVVIKDPDKHKASRAAKGSHGGGTRNAVFGDQGREGRSMLLAAVRMSPVPMCLSDPNQPDNPLVFVNRAFEDLTGYAEDEILGRNCRFLQGPDTDPAVVAEVRRSTAAKVDVCVEFYNYRKDGSGFWNALHLSPVFGDAGDLLYFFGSQLDVTSRREAEAMLRRGQHLHALGSMAASVAREVDTVLAAVRGSLKQARANPSSNLQAQQLAHAARGTEHARRLVQQVLSSAHPPSAEAKLADSAEQAHSPQGSGSDSQLEGLEPAATARPAGDARTSQSAAAPYEGAALVLQPVRVNTQADDEEGCLVFGGERLVAVLVRLSGLHGALAGQWHLEHWFGLLDGPEHPRFASLDAARDWMGRQLGRARASCKADNPAAPPRTRPI